MKINKDNYQAYILDYFEGTLSQQEREALLAFLNAHPDYRKEFEEFENISLGDFETGEDFFSGKSELKKSETLSEEVLFDYTEGNLSGEQKAEADKILNGNPKAGKELQIWQLAKVVPDYSIKYPVKEELKKRAVVIALWQNVYMRAAAALLIFAVFGWLLFGKERDGVGLPFAFLKNELSIERKSSSDHTEDAVKNNNQVAVTSKEFTIRKKKENTVRIEVKLVKNIQEIKDSVFIVQKKENPSPLIKKDSVFNVLALKNHVDTLNKTMMAHGVWKAPEKIPAEKKKFKNRMLDLAVTCLKGLHVIGVKKADAVKNVNPDNGVTDYILVLGEKSYNIRQ